MAINSRLPMLPEFPRAQEAIQQVWNRIMFRALGFSDPLMSQIPIRVQKEGNRAFLGESEMEYQKRGVECACKVDVGKGIPTEEFFTLPGRLGCQLAAEGARDVFNTITTQGPHFGILEKSEPITFATWLAKMEAFELDFKRDGMPRWPQFFVSEEAMAAIKSMMESLAPEDEQKLAALVSKKRKEFDEREARRRLVD